MGARRFIRGVQTIVGMVATLIRGAGEFIGSVRGQNSVNRRSHVVFNGPGESFLWRGTATRSPTLLGGTAPTEVAFARVVFGTGFRRVNGSNWNWEKASDERNQESPSENPGARPDALKIVSSHTTTNDQSWITFVTGSPSALDCIIL
jgi:hypothetical protein